MLDGLREAAFTYGEVGRTRGELPAGYRHLRRRAVNGRGRGRFEEAAGVLLAWGVQRRAGPRVQATGETVAEGVVALVHLGLGPGLDGQAGTSTPSTAESSDVCGATVRA
ncbi:DUF1990 family protein [Amycolatopsis thermoflava]|uniref:Uncharacterized protein DUF1990 n=2 Tax=Amycolatopsis thermoflava TaxID=84480 RepID=A0A3N2HA43_9PSEU|nr:DUF1990 family protein [Amycolatopsis thermoflava]ROS44985.1 uncharacterized protein DUF1990 [Amycolatopsis thermoflava]